MLDYLRQEGSDNMAMVDIDSISVEILRIMRTDIHIKFDET